VKSDIKSDLLRESKARLSKDSHVSDKRRRNLFVEILGLKACFAPFIVRETVIEHRKYGLASISSARDGRPLWIGTTNKSLKHDLKPGDGKFSSPWSSASKLDKMKSAKISYLSGIVADKGLCEKAIKPLVRLASQFWRLGWKDFKGLLSSIIATICSSSKVRRTTALYRLQSKPTLLGRDKTLGADLGKVPLWGWRPRY